MFAPRAQRLARKPARRGRARPAGRSRGRARRHRHRATASPANTNAIIPRAAAARRCAVTRGSSRGSLLPPARDATDSEAFAFAPRFRVGRARPGRRRESIFRFRWPNCPEEIAASLPARRQAWRSTCFGASTDRRAPCPSASPSAATTPARRSTSRWGALRRTSTVDLGGLAAEHRARALALAAAEMVHAMIGAPVPEALQATTPPGAPPPVVSLSTAPLGTDSPAPPVRAQPTVLVGGVAQWLGRPAALLLGARAAFRYPLGEIIVPALSIDGALGSFPVTAAEVTAATVAAGVHVYAGKTAGRFRFEAGPGTRWGWVHLTGRPDVGSTLEGRSLSAAWGGPEVRARAGFGGGGRRAPVVAIELGAGYVALPVRGLRDGTTPVYAVEGPWILSRPRRRPGLLRRRPARPHQGSNDSPTDAPNQNRPVDPTLPTLPTLPGGPTSSS